MSSLKLVLLTLLCLKMVSSQQAFDCSKGCANCTAELGCVECYMTKIVPKTSSTLHQIFGLTQQQSKFDCAPLDSGDSCAAYTIPTSSAPKIPRCEMCKPGYALKLNTQECVQSKITNCAYSTIDYQKQETCRLCVNGFPSDYLNSCVPFADPALGKSANCKQGGIIDGVQTCVTCSSEFSEFARFCVNSPEEFQGCLQLSVNSEQQLRCDHCNVVEGWYKLTAGSNTCTKL